MKNGRREEEKNIKRRIKKDAWRQSEKDGFLPTQE